MTKPRRPAPVLRVDTPRIPRPLPPDVRAFVIDALAAILIADVKRDHTPTPPAEDA